jgi:hypothetical protein
MKPALLFTALLGLAVPMAQAAPDGYLLFDHSTSTLIDPATARSVLQERLPVGLKRLYPLRKWGFVSEVEGGFDDAKVCVITARTLLLPRTATGALIFKPERTATTFGSKPDATSDQCKALAKAKLVESAEALRFSLIGK